MTVTGQVYETDPRENPEAVPVGTITFRVENRNTDVVTAEPWISLLPVTEIAPGGALWSLPVTPAAVEAEAETAALPEEAETAALPEVAEEPAVSDAEEPAATGGYWVRVSFTSVITAD